MNNNKVGCPKCNSYDTVVISHTKGGVEMLCNCCEFNWVLSLFGGFD